MVRGTVSIYIVAYAISSLIVAETQILLIQNPSTRSLTPASMKQHLFTQSVWRYCTFYSTCAKCCRYSYNPGFATSSTPINMMPIWTPVVTINRKEQIGNNDPMLTQNINLSVSPKMNHYRLLLAMTPNKNTNLPINNLSQAKTVTINSLDKVSDSKIYNSKEKSSIYIKANPAKPGVLNNTLISGRRAVNMGNVLGVLANIKPGVSLKNTTNNINHTEINWNATTVPPMGVTPVLSMVNVMHNNNYEVTLNSSNEASSHNMNEKVIFEQFKKTLDHLERKFLLSVFKKLTAISPENRKENGISFLQSGLFLHQLLISLSITMDQNTTQEIEDFLGLNVSQADKIHMLENTASWLPKSNDELKFRWSSRLVLQRPAVDAFRSAAARTPLRLSWLDGNETSAHLTENFNNMVLSDSGGSMRDTFTEDELEAGVCAAALSTVYVRGTWRAGPTLLNDTLPFHDAPAAPPRSSRYFRLNDLMAYTYLNEWDAEAIEISYATPGLTLLILVPKEPSLRPLVEHVVAEGLDAVVGVMNTMRIAVTLPLYTLRMTLLLPNKLQDMGLESLLTNSTNCQPVKLSHAVQRLMFWAEAGRNAFKDDGIEWDPRPELEIVVDRPYMFFVRWENITIMNGVFAL